MHHGIELEEYHHTIVTILHCDDLESNSFGNSNLRLCDLLPRPVPGREAALHHGGFACRWPQRTSTGGIPRVVPEIRPMDTADEAWHLDPPLRAQLSAQSQVDPDNIPTVLYGLFGYVCFASWNWETLCIRLRSKPCRWEFGYVRQPELIHVFVYGKDGPQIVSWTDLMKDVELCNYAFGSGEGLATDLTELANNMGNDDQVTVMQAVSKIQAAAELVEAQERQSWCELPLREVAYALAKGIAFNRRLEAKSTMDLIKAYHNTGQAAKAKDLGLDLLDQQQQRLGPEHPEVARTLNNLSNAHGALREHRTQKDVLERALKIIEQHSGPDHPQVAATLNNLGTAHGDLGDYNTKKDFLERALKIQEQHFGPDHPEVALTLNNLGNAHGALGDHRTQKDLLERALKIKEQHFGADHPEVATTLNNLGNAHGELGDYNTKKDFLERALKIKERHFGADHPQVAATLNNLSNAHGALGHYRTKKDLLERALKIQEQHFGPDHPEVGLTLNNLGNAHGALGDHRTQKDLLERALKIKEQHFGADHPEVAGPLNNLGNAHGDLGDYNTKKDFLERALKIKERHFGADHPQVAQTLNNLGNAHGALGDHRTEKDLLERALRILTGHFGPDHPHVAFVQENLDRVSSHY